MIDKLFESVLTTPRPVRITSVHLILGRRESKKNRSRKLDAIARINLHNDVLAFLLAGLLKHQSKLPWRDFVADIFSDLDDVNDLLS